MLYKFKSKVASDIIMLEANGRQILTIWGKDTAAKGILLPQDMPKALEDLQAAIAADEARRVQAQLEAQERGETLAPPEGVTLRQRATPLIDMVRRAHAAGKEVTWGV